MNVITSLLTLYICIFTSTVYSTITLRSDYKSFIKSTEFNTNWGKWSQWFFCNEGSYAVSFSLKETGHDEDDTAANGFKLLCSDNTEVTATNDMRWGNYIKYSSLCQNNNYIRGFKTNVEDHESCAHDTCDDTALESIIAYCSGENNKEIEVDWVLNWGKWADTVSYCPNGQVVCGFQQSVQPYSGSSRRHGDDTALNGVRLACCTAPQTSPNEDDKIIIEDDKDAQMLHIAQNYAPILKFDQEAGWEGYGYPTNEQKYYDEHCGEETGKKCQNNVLDTVSNPTYYRVIDLNGGDFDIIYYWFYGYQEPCTLNEGSHYSDRETTTVHVKNWQIENVTFSQHTGYYTTDVVHGMEIEGQHPIVYVGKIAHGTYFDTRYGVQAGGCGYFYDYRHPTEPSDALFTWQHLIYRDQCQGQDGCYSCGCNYIKCDSDGDLWKYSAMPWVCIGAPTFGSCE